MAWSGKGSEEGKPEDIVKPRLLEDEPPKFEDHAAQNREQLEKYNAGITDALKTVKLEDFTKVNEIPCMRRAILTAGAMTGITYAVMFATKRNVRKAANWSMMAFLVGSVVTWEQCRHKFRQAEAARLLYEKKHGKQP
ncbi:hypothetical protein TRVA0_001S08328 [Trichomonascus vanleenenianus]|uniref:Cox20p n=1 Tax=Trichomonascus vanleenenianus TaxID=2268995 RepID=UPI003ECA7398